MRIISGKYKGRNILAPSNLPVRPTTDFAKTGLFNILQNRFDFKTCSCLDLFSGTGSISLEFISRGCKQVTAVDRDPGCVSFLNDVARKLEISNLKTVRSEVLQFLKNHKQQYHIVFADPPFDYKQRADLHSHIFNSKLLHEGGILVMEHLTGENYDDLPGFAFERTYGNVTFSFFFNFDATAQTETPA